MHKIMWNMYTFCVIFSLFFSIDQTLGKDHYEINEEYPIFVREFKLKSRSHLASHDDITSTGSTFNHTQSTNRTAKRSRKKTRQLNVEIKTLPRNYRACVKCPREITLRAREGLDGVLLDPPAPVSCKTNLPFSRNLFRIETLFGPEMNIVLPRGRHSLIGKIRNVETGLVERSCLLKFHVIVPRCKGLPHVKNTQLKMFCSAHSIWGSKCAFQCRNNEKRVSHNDPMVCSEESKWIGQEPDCVEDDEDNEVFFEKVVMSNKTHEESCASPKSPKNGKYVCESVIEGNAVNNEKFPPGTTCNIKCNHSYSIPFHLYPFSSIECKNGDWTSVDIEFCYKNERKHHILP